MSYKKLFGNAAIYFGANILNASIPFLLLPILTRVLTPVDYGVVAMFGVAVNIFGAFTGVSVHGAAVRYFQFDTQQMSEYMGTCLRILFVSMALMLGIVVLSGAWLTKLTQVPIDWLLVAVLMSSAQSIIHIRLSLWRVQHRAVYYGSLQISQTFVNAGLSLYLVLALGMAWQGRLLGQIISATLFMVLSLYWLVKFREIAKPSTPRENTVDALKFGIPLIPHVIGGLLISAIDRFMITNLLDLSQAGIYMVVYQIGTAIGLLTQAFHNSYSPWLMGQISTKNTVRDCKIVRGTYLYFIAISLLAIAIGLLAPWLFLLVGKEFRGAAPILIYVAMGQAFSGMYLIVSTYIFFASKTAYLAWITLFTGIFNVIAIYFLIKVNGLIGVAQAFMLSTALKFIGTWLLSHKAHPMPWRQALLPLRLS